ncbi:hypothetical protein AYJ54_05360 [Bradyrhizobium centrolobii]|uniref:Uncharacterized protein n=1 Tax=Bradyrhizobium centrolobii TaxID=1505087 RepID=A0A176Z772_9BRAD|nr:hypothetical protein AYJ54_05360 [Bradyrhizobium centrolobii]
MQRNRLSDDADLVIEMLKPAVDPVERLIDQTFNRGRRIEEALKSGLHNTALANSGPFGCSFEALEDLFGKLNADLSCYRRALPRSRARHIGSFQSWSVRFISLCLKAHARLVLGGKGPTHA